MKLIYAKGACSLSVHILLEELGIPYEAIRVSLDDKTVLESYNRKSYVPALVLDSETVMTEAISILQYLADEYGSSYFPQSGSARAKCIEWLVYLSSEIHKGMGPLFHSKGITSEFEKQVRDKMDDRLQILDDEVSHGRYLMGEQYTIADMYALALLRIGDHVKISLDGFPNLKRYRIELEQRATIQRVIEREDNAKVETTPRTFIPNQEAQFGRENFIKQ
ncbi:MAG: glutathione binding-like protein [Bacteriovoracaceae bacterium]